MKLKVLSMLKEHKDQYISGEVISNELGVSRTAIWKVINNLKKDGYVIESVSRRGYKLVEDFDIISKDELLIDLKHFDFGKDIYYFDSIGSTNDYAKKVAAEGGCEGTIVIADEQTSGRGRRGREWVSEKGVGIWMSMILRPDIEPNEAAKITQIVAAAMASAIETKTDLATYIKWPNDLILESKKVGGILTEMSAELGEINYIVVGMGINVNSERFDDDIKHVATSIKGILGETVSRTDLIVEFVKNFEYLYKDFVESKNLEKTLRICRDQSATIGKEVDIIHRDQKRRAKALDINDDGELIVRYENGEEGVVFFGEVSVRGVNGYI